MGIQVNERHEGDDVPVQTPEKALGRCFVPSLEFGVDDVDGCCGGGLFGQEICFLFCHVEADCGRRAVRVEGGCCERVTRRSI